MEGGGINEFTESSLGVQIYRIEDYLYPTKCARKLSSDEKLN